MKVIEHDLSTEYKTLEIYPLADTHIGDPLSDRKAIDKAIKHVLAKPNRFFVVNGDILNWASRNSLSDIYTEQYPPNDQIDIASDLLAPVKHKVLAIIDGNHEMRAYKSEGVKPLHQVAKRLGIFNCYAQGGVYCLMVSFGKSGGRVNRKMTYAIVGQHGKRGGRRMGSKFNSLEDMQNVIENADVFIQAHTHQTGAFAQDVLTINKRNKLITNRTMLFVNANAWLNYGGYGAVAGYSPTTTRMPKIVLEGYSRKATCTI